MSNRKRKVNQLYLVIGAVWSRAFPTGDTDTKSGSRWPHDSYYHLLVFLRITPVRRRMILYDIRGTWRGRRSRQGWLGYGDGCRRQQPSSLGRIGFVVVFVVKHVVLRVTISDQRLSIILHHTEYHHSNHAFSGFVYQPFF